MVNDRIPETLDAQRASEDRWRAWEAKGRRRDMMLARKMRYICVVVACVGAIALALYYFGER